jgi:uncharacterized protein YjiS (DUF1127 family)
LLSFPLIFSALSYANFALLRRNNIAFQAGEHAYFARREIHRPPAGHVRRKRTTMLSHIVRLFREWKRYNRSLSELSRLGDRELADIGISRSDIQRVAWGAARLR